MEPNQPIQPSQPVPPVSPTPAGAAPVPPVMPAQPVQPAAPAEPVESAQPKIEVEKTADEMFDAPAPKKKSHAAALLAVLFAVLAAGGVGFGVWAMIDKNSASENYNKQIATLRAEINSLNNNAAQDDNSDGETVPPASSETVAVNTEDYIYVGEWGIKIKKPSSWRDVIESYEFNNDYPHAVDSFDILARPHNDKDTGVYISYVGNCTAEQAQTCIDVGGKTILVGLLSGPVGDGEEIVLPENFLEHFQNPDNYSLIYE